MFGWSTRLVLITIKILGIKSIGRSVLGPRGVMITTIKWYSQLYL